jgi:hypothetical protein
LIGERDHLVSANEKAYRSAKAANLPFPEDVDMGDFGLDDDGKALPLLDLR